MKLAQTVAFFGNIPCRDAWGTNTFTGSLDTSKKPLRDTQIAARRILIVEPSVVRPLRNTVLLDGVAYIIGDAFPDYWFGDMLRSNWEIHKADGLATIRTFAQAIAGAGGTTAYVGKVWQKDVKDPSETSTVFNDVSFYLGVNEAMPDNAIIGLGGTNHICQNQYDTASGYLEVKAQELANPSITVVALSTSVYSPVADTNTTTSSVVTALVMRWQEGFKYLSQGTVQYHRGDLQMIVRKADATPTTGSKITYSGLDYTILGIRDEGDCWSLHTRLA